jgi:hypothetical protein
MDKKAIQRRKRANRRSTLGNSKRCIECNAAADLKGLCISCYNKLLREKLTNEKTIQIQ